MLLMECSNIKKYFGDRLILDVKNLKVYSKDRIGIVGVNGVGKTTLINIMCQRLEPDEGWVKLHGRHSYISQLEGPESMNISSEMASKFGIQNIWDENMSGGEKTRFKLAHALSQNTLLLFADEPTSNMDIEGIELMEKSFQEYKGALVLISHDRSFLDKLCNKILELDNGRIKIYSGNYSDYAAQKAREIERAKFEYDEYIKEKKRLQGVIDNTKDKIKSIKGTPKRMGNSEARLHKMGGQKAKAVLERAVKNIEKRIEHLEVKEKPKKQEVIKLDIKDLNKLHSKVIIEGKNINKRFGKKVILDNAEFAIYNNSKVALIGPNGCGKSTLIKMIMENDKSIKVAKGAKIGYFSQDMSILNEELTIIENVMESSMYDETFARILLARLLFKKEDIDKKISVLSGGERVKVSFAKMMLQDINLLILDEPTNYMDINSLEVVENVLKDYGNTILFVSHDRRLIDSVADNIMTIENHKIKIFKGSYKEYLDKKNKSIDNDKEEIQKQILILQNRLSEVIGRLSMPSKKDDIEALDKEYYEILDKLKRLKSCIKTNDLDI
ncbi:MULTISPECIES: ribosomal protection-like ABC-F family protein [Clostridium]|uniref:Putative ABC transporter ATP-binding protein YbiT n=2 Tax=Clostridium TaxID=1485 RepID=A0A151AKL7_9CLOT|nr:MULTISPECIES: ABC-F type ribosomal protection protein [Clostridium]KYH28209.1 putative ABC transporter ATP-binding protein YbiT [Clostridium colicanis DSM 13634]MBE6044283.1 ABC-F type ribosomal protection protein [Clostridium thermopalmarium]PRR76586.1 putative ABC transporter ATP-binding protein YjjK [Clostridium thermopalmarium DSM 5974]PVZ28301.1 macrolide transport system ATP-binding/permease protein [Clostridium thermopalmarium DSM 5974]